MSRAGHRRIRCDAGFTARARDCRKSLLTVNFLRIRLDETDPQGWRERWQQAQQQGDSRKMEAIIEQVNQLLTEVENRAGREAGDKFGE